jgi:4-diphosphocytidyl-2-C-methyl-D-erythritol kinase
MNIIKEIAYAKLNLDLHVINKRNDGYHELKSIVIPLDFYDELYLEISHENEVVSNVLIKDNLIIKVIEEFQKRGHINECVKVTLYKKIPIASGLGGGSANAAATIRGIVKLFNLKLSQNELENIANNLGSDILFCLYNKPAIMSGRGDKLEFIDYPNFDDITLILLPTRNSTPEIFKNLNLVNKSTNFDEQLSKYLSKNVSSYIKGITNDLLPPALETNIIFYNYYERIHQIVPNVFMTGSGPTLYLINPTEKELKNIKKAENIDIIDLKIKK